MRAAAPPPAAITHGGNSCRHGAARPRSQTPLPAKAGPRQLLLMQILINDPRGGRAALHTQRAPPSARAWRGSTKRLKWRRGREAAAKAGLARLGARHASGTGHGGHTRGDTRGTAEPSRGEAGDTVPSVLPQVCVPQYRQHPRTHFSFPLTALFPHLLLQISFFFFFFPNKAVVSIP